MMHPKLLLVVALLIAASASSARLAPPPQTPSLTVEKGHSAPYSRGAIAESYQISSAILKETRRIYIALPGSFSHSAPERIYPVMIVLDGEDNLSPATAVCDELSQNGQIPEMVLVAITNIDSLRGRVRDLTPPGLSVSGSSLDEGGDRFLDFIEKELLPAVDRQFRGSAPRTLIGHSSGGILATYVAATRPMFRAVVAIDTPTEFGDNWLPKKLTARAAAAPTPLRYASYEAEFGWRDETWQKLVTAAPSSWRLHREHLANESHESIGMLAMYLGLREVFSDYSMLAAPVAPTTGILPYYTEIASALGAPVFPPKKLLLRVMEDLLGEGSGAAAGEAYKTLVSGYGTPPDAAAVEARIAELAHPLKPAETVEGLLATPFSTPEEARGFIGEWVGDIWMAPEQPRTGDTMLRIKIVDGRVVGETIRRTLDGQERVQVWEYFKITPQGMTWGNLNGMRPRGVVLFEGKLQGDTLSGKSRFGGINFTLPDGSPTPSPSFSFKRVRK